MITRRHMIAASATVLPLFAADPWRKSSADWSEKDIERILTRSPWAKAASVEFTNMAGMGGMGGGGMGSPGGGMGPGGGGPPGGGVGPGGGGPPGGGIGPGGGGPPGGGMPEIHALVRWDSALPIRAALKQDPAASAPEHIVISVSGLPMTPLRNQVGSQMLETGQATQGQARNAVEMQNRLKEATRLERKGKDPIHAVSIERKDAGKDARMIFTFDSGSEVIQADDKEVSFVTKLGPLQIKARFVLKEMIYQGRLAV